MLSIRRSTLRDVGRIRDVDPMARENEERRQQLASWTAGGRVMIGLVDDSIVGFAVFTDVFFHQPFIELLLVGEAHRRRGYGRALIEHCVATSPGQKVWTSTNTSNAAMRALLEKVGFIESGRVDNLDPGDPELIFVHLPADTLSKPS